MVTITGRGDNPIYTGCLIGILISSFMKESPQKTGSEISSPTKKTNRKKKQPPGEGLIFLCIFFFTLLFGLQKCPSLWSTSWSKSILLLTLGCLQGIPGSTDQLTWFYIAGKSHNFVLMREIFIHGCFFIAMSPAHEWWMSTKTC